MTPLQASPSGVVAPLARTGLVAPDVAPAVFAELLFPSTTLFPSPTLYPGGHSATSEDGEV